MAESGFINYAKIKSDLTPREADSLLASAEKSGVRTAIVFFPSSPLGRSEGEHALSILRSAYRRHMEIYFADDAFPLSGTFFGALSSVPDLRKKEIIRLKREDVRDTDEVLGEVGGTVYAARLPDPDDSLPYGYYPDLTDSYASELAIDFFYKPVINKFKKFASYELKGFFSMKPSFVPPSGGLFYDGETAVRFDIEKLFDNEAEREKYNAELRKKFEENYILKISEYLRSEGLGYAVVPHDGGASEKTTERLNSIPVPRGFLSEGLAAVTGAFAEKKNAVLEIGCGGAFEGLRAFLADFGKNAEVIEPGDGEIEPGAVSTVILNNSPETKTVKTAALERDLVIIDPERGTAYPPPSGEYTFCPFGFLCLKEGEPEIECPPAVGAVVTKRRGETIFETDSLRFTIPDEPLSGSCLEAEGDFKELKILIGASEITLSYAPYMTEMFDFMRGAQCEIIPVGGSVTGVSIAKYE